jgi:hypothetical protein
MNLKQAEQKTIALSAKDGLVDILMGIMFVIFASVESLENAGVSPLASYLPVAVYLAVGIPAFNIVKRRLIAPRTGLVRVSLRHNRQKRNIFIAVIGLQVFTLIIFLLALRSNLGWLPERLPDWLIDAVFGTGIFLVFSMLAYSMQAPRFYLYGFLLGLSLPLGVILQAEGHAFNSLPQAITGIIMALGGIYTLMQFLRTYPVQKGEANGAAG